MKKLYMAAALALLAAQAGAQSITVQGTVDVGNGVTGTFGPITIPMEVTGVPPGGGGEGPPPGGGEGGGPPGTAEDGSANAPAGAPPFPDLLRNYARRPDWKVAGVDYNVGVPAGTQLASPTSLVNSNITVNTSNRQVRASGSGYTISNIDFARDGGWQLILSGSNLTIQNCNFGVGPGRQPMINGNVGGQNNTIKYSTFNSNGLVDNLYQSNITNSGGATVIEYSLIQNAGADLVYIAGSGSSQQNVTLRYNMIYDAGRAPSTHPDWLQLGGGTYNVKIEYNTWYQTAATGGPGTQGIFADSGNNNAKVVGANTIANNTIVTKSGARVNFIIAALAMAGAANTFTITNNYIDPSGNNNAVYKYRSAQNTQTGNINMVTGNALNQ